MYEVSLGVVIDAESSERGGLVDCGEEGRE
jgi:hypothetical protein